jgi:2-polyprenyl-6-methoxyphenol hydroxylase-like FAD-dependent oxidoreductase
VGLRIGEREYRAPLTIAADGPASAIRARLGLCGPRRAGRLGIVTHFRLAGRVEAPPWVEVFVGPGHEFYVTPLPEQRLLVACLMPTAKAGGLSAATRLFYEQLRAHPSLSERLQGATQLTPFQARAPLAVRASRGWHPGALLLGDAAEAFDPITGGGIAQALVCSEALAPFAIGAIEDGDVWLERFDRERSRRLRDHRWLTAFVLAMADKPWLAGPLLRFLAGHPRLFSHLVGVGGGTRPLLGWPRCEAAEAVGRSEAPEGARHFAAIEGLPATSDAREGEQLTQRAREH